MRPKYDEAAPDASALRAQTALTTCATAKHPLKRRAPGGGGDKQGRALWKLTAVRQRWGPGRRAAGVMRAVANGGAVPSARAHMRATTNSESRDRLSTTGDRERTLPCTLKGKTKELKANDSGSKSQAMARTNTISAACWAAEAAPDPEAEAGRGTTQLHGMASLRRPGRPSSAEFVPNVTECGLIPVEVVPRPVVEPVGSTLQWPSTLLDNWLGAEVHGCRDPRRESALDSATPLAALGGPHLRTASLVPLRKARRIKTRSLEGNAWNTG